MRIDHISLPPPPHTYHPPSFPSHAHTSLLSLPHTHTILPTEIPALPPIQQPTEPEKTEQDSEWGDSPVKEQKFKKTSGPRTQDPYASDDSWFMPITIAVAVFLPVLFCLCRVR